MKSELRCAALAALLEPDLQKKCELIAAIKFDDHLDARTCLDEPSGIPGRPEVPILVAPGSVKKRSMHTVEGRAAMIHALAHIEFNAINLAADIIWRFPDMPNEFYFDWLRVCKEEAQHFQMLRAHLRTLGFDYGSFEAHDSLWEMAYKTRHDLIARLALVPRTFEARGLDAVPSIRAKLAQAGDQIAADILDIILRDEVGHVAVGNRWYLFLCEKNQVDKRVQYRKLAAEFKAPVLRGPFNLEMRRAAGFDEDELAELEALQAQQKG